MYLFRLGLSSNPNCQVATEVRNSRGSIVLKTGAGSHLIGNFRLVNV